MMSGPPLHACQYCNGQDHTTNRPLIVLPHEETHETLCRIKKLSIFRLRMAKIRARKEAVPLIPNSLGGAKGASAQMPRHMYNRPASI